MVQESVHKETIHGCSAKEFFDTLYANSDAAQAYHKEVNKDDNAQVEKWEGNTRTVHFTMPMQLPAIVSKMIGTSTIPVKEVQQAEIDSDGTLHITSTPIIGVPGGSKFRALAKLAVTNVKLEDGTACEVVAKVTCIAEGPWGLQGMIEGIMVEQSSASLKTYLAFCTARCHTALSQKAGAGDSPVSPRSDTTAFEQFFDAQETISRMSSLASSQGTALAAHEVVDTIALVQLLDTLEGRLRLAGSDAAALRALIPDASRSSPSGAPALPSSRISAWSFGVVCGAGAAVVVFALLQRQR